MNDAITELYQSGAGEIDPLEQAAGCLRTIAHPVRLRMIQILLQGSCPVGELARACNLPSHMASEHLRLLKDRGFLRSERQGRKVFYHIAEPCLKNIIECIEHRFCPGESE